MAYAVSLAAGVLVGVIYGLLNVHSPAPPLIALVGLLGILGGERGVAYARAYLAPPATQHGPTGPASDRARPSPIEETRA